MLVTEKVAQSGLVTQQGERTQVDNVPAVLAQGQGGMLGVFVRRTTRPIEASISPIRSLAMAARAWRRARAIGAWRQQGEP